MQKTSSVKKRSSQSPLVRRSGYNILDGEADQIKVKRTSRDHNVRYENEHLRHL